MTSRFRATSAVLWTIGAILLGGSSTAARAEQTPVGVPGQVQEPARTPDFLFGAPRGSIALRGTWRFARAGSDLFDFVTRELTLEKGDFNSPGVGVDLFYRLMPRLEGQFGFEWNRATRSSEYRDFVDNLFLPIQQTTRLEVTHLNAGVRYALTPRGQEVSRFAWVPRRFVPFAGAGAGAVYYNLTQSGDFVDFVDRSVFRDAFGSKGWAPSAYVAAGVDIRIYRALYAAIEGRYSKASATLGTDFVDFDPIDLSGFKLGAGINLLF